MRIFKLITIILFTFFIGKISTFAYTKDDIINLKSKVTFCSDETANIANDLIISYSKLIKERDITSKDLNKIYNNVNKVLNILKDNKLCSIDQASKVSNSVKNELKSLYEETNNIIKNAPKIIPKSNSSTNSNTTKNKSVISTGNDNIEIVFDSSSKSIKIYEGSILSDVVSIKKELNYVGTNKILVVLISCMTILFALSLLKILIKKDIISICVFYISLLCLMGSIPLKNEISYFLDLIPKMNNRKETRSAIVIDKEIISYPSYGNNYGYIKINEAIEKIYYGDSSDLLKMGIGQATNSKMPGEDGSIVLSGHNTGIFKNLNDLQNGNNIEIETLYGVFTYKVIKTNIVDKTDIDSIKKDYDLIMYTCYPNSDIYGSKRLVVYASLEDSKWIGE